jgi:hypothetical protein
MSNVGILLTQCVLTLRLVTPRIQDVQHAQNRWAGKGMRKGGGSRVTIWSCCLYVFYEYYYHNIFFINVYVVLFLFNNVIYVFLLYDCTFMYDYPDWGFFRAFSSVAWQMPGWCPQRRGTARTLPNFCVVVCILCFVSFCVLFVCICVLYYCHRVATQLQLNISYHIISYHPVDIYTRVTKLLVLLFFRGYHAFLTATYPHPHPHPGVHKIQVSNRSCDWIFYGSA